MVSRDYRIEIATTRVALLEYINTNSLADFTYADLIDFLEDLDAFWARRGGAELFGYIYRRT